MTKNSINSKAVNKKEADKKQERLYLEGERSGHVEKLVNRLGSWKFFQVLYGNNMMRMFGMNIFMTILALPALYGFFYFTMFIWQGLSSYYPASGMFLFNSTIWFGFEQFNAGIQSQIASSTALWGGVMIVWSTLILSGGFAVIRDSFWTGKLKVLKTFFKGIVESAPIMFVFMLVLGGLFAGICMLYQLMLGVMVEWLAIVLIILAWIVFVEIAVYVMVLYSVVSVHKQSIIHSMSDAWILYKANIIPNTISFVFAFTPVVYFLMTFGGNMNMITQLLMIMLLMIGMFYTVFVWQTHMMKTFRLYHPVELKRVK